MTVARPKQALTIPAAAAPISTSGFPGKLCARKTAIAQKPTVKPFNPNNVIITFGFIFKTEKSLIHPQL